MYVVISVYHLVRITPLEVASVGPPKRRLSFRHLGGAHAAELKKFRPRHSGDRARAAARRARAGILRPQLQIVLTDGCLAAAGQLDL